MDTGGESPSQTASETNSESESDAPTETDVPSEDQSDADPSDDGEGSEPAPVAVHVDGERAATAEVCSGADGAVIATLDDGRVVQLVREDAEPVLRLVDGEVSAEAAAQVATAGDFEVFTAAVEAADAQVDVQMDVSDLSDIGDCDV